MRRFLAAQFAPVLRAWRNGYEAEVRRAAIAFFLLVFLAFGVCLAVPELRLGFSAYLQHLFQGMDLTDGAGNLSPLLLLANNLRACAVTMLYGLIPFVRLPALALGVNAVLLGGLAACYAATDTTMLLYAASLLPHGIFELPALILAFSMGLYICGHLTRRRRRDPAAVPPAVHRHRPHGLRPLRLIGVIVAADIPCARGHPVAQGIRSVRPAQLRQLSGQALDQAQFIALRQGRRYPHCTTAGGVVVTGGTP